MGASVILATSAFPQYAPARKEVSYEPASNSSPEKAERATRDNVKATRDPNYIPKKAPATKDSNYIKEAKKAKRDTKYVPKIAPAQREGSNEPASYSPPKNAVKATRDPNYVPKNAPATRDPNYIEKANPTCDCSKTRQEVQAVPLNTANLAPAQQEGKPSAPVKPLK